MRMVKVYDAQGNHVDSFRKSIDKRYYTSTSQKIIYLNGIGYYVRRQFSHSGKTLQDYVK